MATCHTFLVWTVLVPFTAGSWNNWGSSAVPAAESDDAAAANVPPSSSLASVALKKQYVPVSRNGTVVAYKTAYYGEVIVGNPKRTFTVVYDTGSGHLIIPSVDCNSETCMKHSRYQRKASTTAVDIEHNGNLITNATERRDQVTITFGTGKVVGDFVEDQSCIGGAHLDDYVCTTHRIVLGTDMTAEPFGLFDFDGVLGLGFPTLALNPHFSILGQMAEQHPSLLPQFSVYLARNEEEGSSWITFGGHDPEKAASEFLWSPVAMQDLGYWQVRLKAVRMGDEVLDDCVDGTCRAILDTGSSLMGAPRSVVRSMHQGLARALEGEEAERFGKGVDCRKVPGPVLSFDLEGGGSVTVSHEDYSRPASVNVTLEEGKITPFCRATLLPLDLKEPLGPKTFIFGEPVLRKYYQIYDWGEKRVGLALARRPETKAGPEKAHTSNELAKGTLVTGAPLLVQTSIKQ